MKSKRMICFVALLAIVTGCVGLAVSAATPSPFSSQALPSVAPLADDPNSPASTVKLIFIHHSCGENWLADGDGGLGIALRDNNYFVSDTNYGWGPDSIGDNTDIGHWWDWFRGSSSSTYLSALYTEYGDHSYNYTRLTDPDPSRENEIIMFKSCYPNSNLGGNADDPPTTGSNPLRGQDSGSEHHTVANAKGIYNDLLVYFAAHQEKLFVVITAPPVTPGDSWEPSANARAFNNWLVDDWLDGYAHDNVAVFDFYNVLTSNGGNANTNDLGQEDGNHHRWWNGAVQHCQTVDNDLAAYGSGDSHPTAAGNRKATAEFVPLLNVYYNRWKSGASPTPTPPPGPDAVTDLRVSHAVTGTGTLTATLRWTPATDAVTTTLRYTDTLITEANWVSAALLTDTLPGSADIFTAVVPYEGDRTYFALKSQNAAGRWSNLSNNSPWPPFRIYLPLILKAFSAPTPTPTSTPTTQPPSETIQPTDLTYLGAFRLPGGDTRPETFSYGGNAMTFNPSGDSSGPNDGFPGSLFVTGHDRLAYGELPDGSQVAEISIPVPVESDSLDELNQAGFLQAFHDVAEGYFTELEEIPRIGMEYLHTSATGSKIHLAWGQHMPPDPPVASHAWFDPHLSAPNMQGTWFIGNQSLNSVNGYMFEIPASWADEHAEGRYLGTGRFRDGGWSGMGPALFAYRPWIDDSGTPAPSGTHLEETVLLLYESSESTSNIERCLNGYQHPDEWEGGAWLTTNTDKSAVLFAGTKGTGAKYWYGYVNPAGPEYPCVHGGSVGEFTVCRLADGTPCPGEDLTECDGHNDYRGWWSARFDAQFILYDPADLVQVAAGEMESWQPQPYASLDIDEHLFLNPAGVEQDMLGTGVQRRSRIGAVAYDRSNDLLYVLELFADEAKPVVHVWRVDG